MRTTIAIATFLAVGTGVIGVGALNLKGSDTLKDLTVELLTDASPDCGGTGQAGTLIYDGTGSGNGANVDRIFPRMVRAGQWASGRGNTGGSIRIAAIRGSGRNA